MRDAGGARRDPKPLERRRNLTRTHDLDNLYVVDTIFFPSSSAVNPALTAMANALRVGDHLSERLGAPSGERGAAEPRAGRSSVVTGGMEAR